jgi:hypothetical protein
VGSSEQEIIADQKGSASPAARTCELGYNSTHAFFNSGLDFFCQFVKVLIDLKVLFPGLIIGWNLKLQVKKVLQLFPCDHFCIFCN